MEREKDTDKLEMTHALKCYTQGGGGGGGGRGGREGGIIGGSCHKYHFCCDKSFVMKNIFLLLQT